MTVLLDIILPILAIGLGIWAFMKGQQALRQANEVLQSAQEVHTQTLELIKGANVQRTAESTTIPHRSADDGDANDTRELFLNKDTLAPAAAYHRDDQVSGAGNQIRETLPPQRFLGVNKADGLDEQAAQAEPSEPTAEVTPRSFADMVDAMTLLPFVVSTPADAETNEANPPDTTVADGDAAEQARDDAAEVFDGALGTSCGGQASEEEPAGTRDEELQGGIELDASPESPEVLMEESMAASVDSAPDAPAEAVSMTTELDPELTDDTPTIIYMGAFEPMTSTLGADDEALTEYASSQGEPADEPLEGNVQLAETPPPGELHEERLVPPAALHNTDSWVDLTVPEHTLVDDIPSTIYFGPDAPKTNVDHNVDHEDQDAPPEALPYTDSWVDLTVPEHTLVDDIPSKIYFDAEATGVDTKGKATNTAKHPLADEESAEVASAAREQGLDIDVMEGHTMPSSNAAQPSSLDEDASGADVLNQEHDVGTIGDGRTREQTSRVNETSTEPLTSQPTAPHEDVATEALPLLIFPLRGPNARADDVTQLRAVLLEVKSLTPSAPIRWSTVWLNDVAFTVNKDVQDVLVWICQEPERYNQFAATLETGASYRITLRDAEGRYCSAEFPVDERVMDRDGVPLLM